MDFLSDFEIASKDILEKIDREAISKYYEKGIKSKCLDFADRFINILKTLTNL